MTPRYGNGFCLLATTGQLDYRVGWFGVRFCRPARRVGMCWHFGFVHCWVTCKVTSATVYYVCLDAFAFPRFDAALGRLCLRHLCRFVATLDGLATRGLFLGLTTECIGLVGLVVYPTCLQYARIEAITLVVLSCPT